MSTPTAPLADAPAAATDVPALYAAHWHSMVRLAVLLVDDLPTAEDVVQDAFLSLHRHSGRLRAPESALGYVRSAVVNGCRSQLRHRAVVRRKLRPVPDDEDPGQRRLLDAVEADPEVTTALRSLPPRMQEVLVLRYWADLTEAQIATTLGISAGSVKSTSSRGLDKLRAVLGGDR